MDNSEQEQQRETESPMASLPESCIAAIISFTTPRDACRLSSVSSIFKSAAESDRVWEGFLPPEYQSIISMSSPCLPSSSSSSSTPASLLLLPTKKELFLSLCDHPILIDDRKKAFFLDKQSGKKCHMISSRDLVIAEDNPGYWGWISHPSARFQKVAKLKNVCMPELLAKISTRILSPGTNYAAYLVYEKPSGTYSPRYRSLGFSVGLGGTENQNRSVYTVRPNKRRDNWYEVKLGDFYNAGDEDDELEMSVMGVRGGHWVRGLIIQGIEVRPPKQGE